MNCYYCGHEVGENSVSCENCGQQFEGIIISRPSLLWRLLVLTFYIVLAYYLFQIIGFWILLLMIVLIIWLAKKK